MNLNEQETQYIIQAIMRQPIGEALPLFLKLTGQKVVPAEPLPDLREVKGSA
jgi:hypothetical protein